MADKCSQLSSFLDGVKALASKHKELRGLVVGFSDGNTVDVFMYGNTPWVAYILKYADGSLTKQILDPAANCIEAQAKPIEVKEKLPQLRPRDRAKSWLREQLCDERKLSSDLFKAAQEEKICGARTLRTAATELGVQAIKEGPDGRWYWALTE